MEYGLKQHAPLQNVSMNMLNRYVYFYFIGLKNNGNSRYRRFNCDLFERRKFETTISTMNDKRKIDFTK